MSTSAASSIPEFDTRCLAAPAARDPVWILGTPFSALSYEEAVAAIAGMLNDDRPHQVVLANAHTVTLACRAPAYRRTLSSASLVLRDGVGVEVASLLAGTRLSHNFVGTDFIPSLLRRLGEQAVRVFLYGAQPGVGEIAGRALERACPGIRIVGVEDGYSGRAMVAARIRAARPDILLVALGNPLQEQWIADNLAGLGVRVAVGVGALLDYLAGSVRRAPSWVRRMRMEWAFRLAIEPARLWRRYLLGNAEFLCRLAGEACAQRAHGLWSRTRVVTTAVSSRPVAPETMARAGHSNFAAPGRALAATVGRRLKAAATPPRTVVLYTDLPDAAIASVTAAIDESLGSAASTARRILLVPRARPHTAVAGWTQLTCAEASAVRLESTLADDGVAVPRLLLGTPFWITATALRSDRRRGLRTPLTLHSELLAALNPGLPWPLLAGEAYRLTQPDLSVTFVAASPPHASAWVGAIDLLTADRMLARAAGVPWTELPQVAAVRRRFDCDPAIDAEPSVTLGVAVRRGALRAARRRARVAVAAFRARRTFADVGRAVANLHRAPAFLQHRLADVLAARS